MAFPNDEIIRLIGRKEYEVFHNNLASYLTNGKCKILYNCYNFMVNYKRQSRRQNHIFGVSDKFLDFDNLVSLIEKQNWHFLIGKMTPNDPNEPIVQKLMNLYGICMGRSTGGTRLDYGGNYCSNVTNDKISVCN